MGGRAEVFPFKGLRSLPHLLVFRLLQVKRWGPPTARDDVSTTTLAEWEQNMTLGNRKIRVIPFPAGLGWWIRGCDGL